MTKKELFILKEIFEGIKKTAATAAQEKLKKGDMEEANFYAGQCQAYDVALETVECVYRQFQKLKE